MNVNFGKNYFDCSVSMHTLYHIEKKLQKKVVDKLIKETKKNSPIIIVYSNPNTIISKISKLFKKKDKKKNLYFYCHNNKWWSQFKKIANIEIKPWRSFSAQHQKMIFPNNSLGRITLDLLFVLENYFPKVFSNFFQYQMIIIIKK